VCAQLFPQIAKFYNYNRVHSYRRQSAGKTLVTWMVLSGFVDGEGSFNASLRKGNGHRLGWQVQLTFNVAQREI
jgi:hypothetical protein